MVPAAIAGGKNVSDDAAVIARAMGCRVARPALPDETDGAGLGPGEPVRPAPLDCLEGEPGACGAAEDGAPTAPRRSDGLVRV